MKDKRILVTGGNRGLGFELCRQLSAAGGEVTGTARRPGAASALRFIVRPRRIEALDLAEPESVAALARQLGDQPLDVLINNAGIGGPGPGIDDLDLAAVERHFAINAVGPMRVVQALLPNLRRGVDRKIVHISSVLGSIAENRHGSYYGYRASKAALNMLNRTLAEELGKEGFICVVLHPGWVKTGMGGPSAPLEPEESVRGLLQVIADLGPEHNGAFLDHRGQPVPW